MTVAITFQPAGLTGLVAEGCYVADAGKRMGIAVLFDCKGTGECTCCEVSILKGAELLSLPSIAEQRILSAEALGKQLRLACQARIERSGELVVELHTEKETKKTPPGDAENIRKQFGDLTLNKKIATLIQFEAQTMYEAMNALVDKPLALGEKIFDRLMSKTKAAQAAQRNEQQKS